VKRPTILAAGGFFLAVLALSFSVGTEIHIPVGGARGPLLMSGLGPSETATSLPGAEAADGRRDFYFRQILSLSPEIAIPLRPRGPFSMSLRADVTVRTSIDVLEEGQVLSREFVGIGPWRESKVAAILRSDTVGFTLRLQDAPLVGRSDPETFRRFIDEIVLQADHGFELPWRVRAAAGALLAFLVFLTRRFSERGALFLLGLGPLALGGLLVLDPVALALALPRLLLFVVLASILILALGRFLNFEPRVNAMVAFLGSGMVLAYGYLSFLPNHSPADLDIHIWRAVDLENVPPTYAAWLRYGSHYPTPSQIRGSATEALGEGPPLPYSPLPYVLFYGAQSAGLDLHWSMNAIEATCLALLLPLVFALGQAASSRGGGLLAAALMATDLASVHRLGRAHAPAVVGGALGLAALLALGLALPRLHEPGRWRRPALALGLGALGYSSTPVFYALFGIALVAFTLLSSTTRPLVRPLTVALAVGGLTALALFYGHYLPGLWQGGGSTLVSDPFPGRTFFIFHNESRQSLRLWRLGLFVPFLAAIPAGLVVLRRCAAWARAYLFAWIAAWAGIMVMKEPFAFPLVLRWAKEDFYAAPALALMVAIGVARLESRPLRIGLGSLALAGALFLRVQDYGFHANTLRFLQ